MAKIERARVVVTSPGRNFVTLVVETSDGLRGVGDATLNGRELAVEAYLNDHVIPCLIGRDAHRIEDIWQFLYRGAYWRRGPITMSAIAAVDTALWDIKGKVAGLPLYQLLGGASRESVMVYGHANGSTVAETVERALEYQEQGYKAIRLQSGVPGLASTYGVSKDKYFYEPADADVPSENVWSTEKYMRSVPELFAAARDALGWDVHLLHDVHHRLTPIEAARLGKDLEPYRLFWLEDAVVADNPESFRLIRQHTTTPLAVGEIFNSIWDAKLLIQEQLIDYIRATVVHAGGIRREGSRVSPTCSMSVPAATERPTCPRSRWPRRYTSTCQSRTSGCRNICCTPRRPTPSSRMRTHSKMGRCTQGKRQVSASTSMRNWRPNIRTSAPISR